MEAAAEPFRPLPPRTSNFVPAIPVQVAQPFGALCPPERYFDTHPEYFSLVGGKRQSGYAQLCLTNPDVLRSPQFMAEIVRLVKEELKREQIVESQRSTDTTFVQPPPGRRL